MQIYNTNLTKISSMTTLIIMTAKIQFDDDILRELFKKHGTATGIAKELNISSINTIWKNLNRLGLHNKIKKIFLQ